MSRKAPFRTRIRVDGTTLSTRIEQPDESDVLAENLRRQNNSGHRLWSASFPDITREVWRREGREDLLRGDRKALEKYVASPEGRKYSTMPRGRSRAFSRGGL
jgi:hypothetical protein